MRGGGRIAIVSACAVWVSACAVWAASGTGLAEGIEGDAEYGAYLAQECSTCHQSHASPVGIPVIAGLETDYFLAALRAYKEGGRTDSTMRSIARSLDDEAMAALAAHYARQ